MSRIQTSHPLHRMFAGLIEQIFITRFGIGDPPLLDYLTELLSKFIHVDTVYKLRNIHGRRIEEVAEMVIEAAAVPETGRTHRELHRHIGDFALFWTGVYPEAVDGMRTAISKDFFIDYCAQGKRSYYIASTFEDESHQEESRVLRLLSEEFEVCAFGLNEVSKEWKELQPEGAPGKLIQ